MGTGLSPAEGPGDCPVVRARWVENHTLVSFLLNYHSQ